VGAKSKSHVQQDKLLEDDNEELADTRVYPGQFGQPYDNNRQIPDSSKAVFFLHFKVSLLLLVKCQMSNKYHMRFSIFI
jgi:hypothetical protein